MEIPTPSIVLACGNTRLETKLRQFGVRFVHSDITQYPDLLALIEDAELSITHAIVHQTIFFGYPIKKCLERMKLLRPDLKILLIMPKKGVDDRTLSYISALGVEIIEDNSSALPQILLSKLDVSGAVSCDTEASIAPDTKAPEAPEEIATPELPAEKEVPPAPKTTVKSPKPVKRSPLADAVGKLTLPTVALPKKPSKLEKATPVAVPDFIPDIVSRRPTIISVFGTSHGTGCTWLSMQIGTYLSKLGKTAISGEDGVVQMNKKKYKEGDPGFSFNGINFYAFTPLSAILSKGYSYVVLDAGVPLSFSRSREPNTTISNDTMNELLRSDLRICVSEVAPWTAFMLTHYMDQELWQGLMQNSILTLSCRTAPVQATMLNAQYGRSFLPLPFCSPFDLNGETNAFLASLLMSIIPNPK